MEQLQDGVAQAARTAKAEAHAYRGDETRPLGGYVVLMALFGALLSGAAGLAFATGRRLPDGVGPSGPGAPGCRHPQALADADEGRRDQPAARAVHALPGRPGGPGEVMEEVRHRDGLRHSIGELITCPFCLDVWIAAGFTIGLVFAPRLTRLIAAALTAITGADFLHLLYAKAQESEG